MTYLHGSVLKDTATVLFNFNCYDAQTQYANVSWFAGYDHASYWNIWADQRWQRDNAALQDAGATTPTWTNVNSINAGDLARWSWQVPYGWEGVTLEKASICWSGKNTTSDSDDWRVVIAAGPMVSSAAAAHSNAAVTMAAKKEFDVTGTEQQAGDRLYVSTQTIGESVAARDFIMLSMTRKGERSTSASSDGDIVGQCLMTFSR